MRENSLGMRLEFVQFHASDVDGVNLSRVGNGLLLKEIPVSYSVHTDSYSFSQRNFQQKLMQRKM